MTLLGVVLFVIALLVSIMLHEAGHMVCVFAEGSISRTGNLLPFKRGLEKIVDGLDVPIIPVHLDRLWGSIFSFESGRFLWKWPKRIPYPVTVSFGKPMPSTSDAHAVRQALLELGSEATTYSKSSSDLLDLRFIRTAKKNWGRFAMADTTGRELTYGSPEQVGVYEVSWGQGDPYRFAVNLFDINESDIQPRESSRTTRA